MTGLSRLFCNINRSTNVVQKCRQIKPLDSLLGEAAITKQLVKSLPQVRLHPRHVAVITTSARSQDRPGKDGSDRRTAAPARREGCKDSLGPFQKLSDVPPAPAAVVVSGLVTDHDDALLGPDGREASPRHWVRGGENSASQTSAGETSQNPLPVVTNLHWMSRKPKQEPPTTPQKIPTASLQSSRFPRPRRK